MLMTNEIIMSMVSSKILQRPYTFTPAAMKNVTKTTVPCNTYFMFAVFCYDSIFKSIGQCEQAISFEQVNNN